MYTKHRVEIEGRFSAEVFNEAGEVTQKIDEFHNTVLDCGMISWYNYSIEQMMTYVNVGSSSVVPEVTQTGLQDFKFTTNNKFVGDAELFSKMIGNIYVAYRRIYQFGIGACTGDFTEVGVSRGGNSEYFNRQLFKNAEGNPIVVRVAANEGLRITCEIRVYCDPAMIPYGAAYKLDTKGATAGSINIGKVGGSSANFTATALNALVPGEPNGSFRERIEGFLPSTYSVAFFEKDVNNPNIFWILFHTDLAADPNLSIFSQDFTGGSAAPTLETIIAFNPSENFPWHEYSFEDITAGSTVTYHYNKLVAFSRYYDASHPWSQGPGYSYASLVNQPISNLGFSLNNCDASSTQILSTPTAESFKFTRKNYWGVGRFTTGNPVNITYGWVGYGNSGGNRACYSFAFQEPIQVSNSEELWAEMEFSWGRKVI